MPSTNDPQRDLLFGLLSLQIGLIEQGQLFVAFAAWSRDKVRLPEGDRDRWRLVEKNPKSLQARSDYTQISMYLGDSLVGRAAWSEAESAMRQAREVALPHRARHHGKTHKPARTLI